MLRPCPQKIDCPPVLPYTNYSAETIKLIEYYGNPFPPGDTPYGDEWKATGCLGIGCVSTISQEDADLCALRQLALCQNTPPDGPPPLLYPNDPQECQVECPDGSIFTTVVPAGLFIATTLEEANALAIAWCEQQAPLKRFCLGPIVKCCCQGQPYQSDLEITPHTDVAPTVTVESGTFPPGLTFDAKPDRIEFRGSPTSLGNYLFVLRATDASGNHVDRLYEIWVPGIADGVLPAATANVPYSHQLTVVGGSGSYAFKILSGNLPAGLSLSLTGLISGTPTGVAGTNPIIFELVDTECETVDQSFFPPAISLSTIATTRVATLRGYNEFVASNPPKKYKRIDFTGHAYEWAETLNDPVHGITPVGEHKIVWTGAGEINSAGIQLTEYDRDEFIASPDLNFWPFFLPNASLDPNLSVLYMGYCWTGDPDCHSCNIPPIRHLDGDSGDPQDDLNTHFIQPWVGLTAQHTVATIDSRGTQPTGANWKGDWSRTTAYAVGNSVKREDMYYTCLVANTDKAPERFPGYWNRLSGFTYTGVLNLPAGVRLPTIEINNLANWVRMMRSIYVQATLSQEYTDAEALANAVVYQTNGNTAESRPRTTGFVSRYTSVDYRLNCTNLIVGQAYVAWVKLLDTATGTFVYDTFNFTAVGTTEVIHGTVPTPAPQHPIQVLDPSIEFA